MNTAVVEIYPREQVVLPARALFSLSLIVFALLLALLLVVARDALLRDPDTLWHIGVGRRILQTGSFPRVDHLSHTFEGYPWIARDWLSEIIFALMYQTGGWRAVAGVTVGAIALTFTLLFWALARQLRLTAALSIALVAYALASAHFSARPHILSYPVMVLWLAGLVHAVESRTSPSLLLLPLMTLWANLHGSFTLGLALGGLLAVEAIFKSSPKERWSTLLRWAIFLAAASVAGLLTPYGYRSAYVTIQVFGGNEALDHITEWQALNFAQEVFGGPLIIGIVFVGFLVGVKIKPMRLIIVTITFYMMLVHIRMVPIFALVTPLLISSSLRAQFPFLSAESQAHNQPGLFDKLLRASRLHYALILSALIAGPPLAAFCVRGIAPRNIISPVAAVDYVLRTDPSGRLYNDFSFGGYLIFRNVKTFIDGRTDQLFGGGFMAKTFGSPSKPNDEFIELLETYKITSALVSPKSGEALKLDQVPSWRRRHEDDIAVVYQRTPPSE
jgi:hypothetical protein